MFKYTIIRVLLLHVEVTQLENIRLVIFALKTKYKEQHKKHSLFSEKKSVFIEISVASKAAFISFLSSINTFIYSSFTTLN